MGLRVTASFIWQWLSPLGVEYFSGALPMAMALMQAPLQKREVDLSFGSRAWRSIDADGIAGEEKGMAVVIALRAVGSAQVHRQRCPRGEACRGWC
jgi:hypothetical protein